METGIDTEIENQAEVEAKVKGTKKNIEVIDTEVKTGSTVERGNGVMIENVAETEKEEQEEVVSVIGKSFI